MLPFYQQRLSWTLKTLSNLMVLYIYNFHLREFWCVICKDFQTRLERFTVWSSKKITQSKFQKAYFTSNCTKQITQNKLEDTFWLFPFTFHSPSRHLSDIPSRHPTCNFQRPSKLLPVTFRHQESLFKHLSVLEYEPCYKMIKWSLIFLFDRWQVLW